MRTMTLLACLLWTTRAIYSQEPDTTPPTVAGPTNTTAVPAPDPSTTPNGQQSEPSEVDEIAVSFKVAEFKAQRSRAGTLVAFELDADGLESGRSYKVSVLEADGTDLHASAYTLEVPFTTLEGTGDKLTRKLYLYLKPDSLPGRDHHLVFKVDVTSDAVGVEIRNTGINTTVKVTVVPAGPELDGYNYMAYVGTNFDLVDGVQAKNLFLAVNTYLPAKSDLRLGHFISLYGNRAFTTIDSSGTVVRLSSAQPISDSTYRLVRTTSKRVTEYVADNIGAYYAPLIRLGKAKDRAVRCSLAPSAEFIWRRVTRTTSYSEDLPFDTLTYGGTIANTIDFPSSFAERENRFEFKVGPGVFIAHDNDKISVHLYMNTGFSTLYIPQGRPKGVAGEYDYGRLYDWYFAGRLWITEPHSGITLQAEIANSFFHPQPYYVVTLSKAINFKNLGNFFAPVTGRG